MLFRVDNRMLELLWLVGYCREFPSQLADRISGHPDWNRHVKYEAIKKGYLSVHREEYRQRVIRSLRLMPDGLKYIGTLDPYALSFIMAKQDSRRGSKSGIDRILRFHAQATALVMAYRAGVRFLPGEKPSLLADPLARTAPYDPNGTYYYSSNELRDAIEEKSELATAKTSRLLGVIVHGHYCHCLYHTGHTRMFWLSGTEENMTAAAEQVLTLRGFPVSVFTQIIIGSKMTVAKKLMRTESFRRSRYFTLSDRYNNIHFVTNDSRGDDLLSVIIDPEKQAQVDQLALEDFIPPDGGRTYDALTPDGKRPVVLGYTCDLSAFSNLSAYMRGFKEPTIVLCYDYQLNTIQSIVETPTEVRIMKGGDTP